MNNKAHLPDDPESLFDALNALGVRFWLEDDRLRCSGPDTVLNAEVGALLKDKSAHIVEVVKAREFSNSTSAPNTEQASQGALSFAQQRLWFLDQMQTGNPVYNLPLAIELRGNLDLSALNRSFSAIVARHEILRTRYSDDNSVPTQVVELPVAVNLVPETVEGEHVIDAVAKETAGIGFNLSVAPPVSLRLLRIEADHHVVLLTIHHIAADGWSLEILLKELAAFYRAELLGLPAELPPLALQYSDYAAAQRRYLAAGASEKQLAYWREKLAGELPVLQLPGRGTRTRVQTYGGAVVPFTISRSSTEQIRALSGQRQATVFMALLSVFKLLLYRYSGQQDVIVGTPVANRRQTEHEGLIGLFVNTLVLRDTISEHMDFFELLSNIRNTVLDAQEHQDLPFEQLVEALQPDRDLSISPLFQIKFRLENAPVEKMSLPGLEIRRRPHALITAKVDLSVDLYETDDGITGAFEYNTDLFDEQMIEQMARHFVHLIDAVSANPSSRLSDLDFMDAEERTRQAVVWNDTQIAFDEKTCFHKMFERQVLATPSSVALVYDGKTRSSVSYDELNKRANKLAHALIARDVRLETVVGIAVERSADMVVALLAVLKSGAAYLPLDVTYPPERLRYMLSDSGASVLLTQSDIELETDVPQIELDNFPLDDFDTANPNIDVSPENLAYLIYTSGSTGRPKAVLIQHGGLVNLTEDKIRKCQVEGGDVVLQFFSFSFDASVPEFIMSLAVGATLVVASPQNLLPGNDLHDLLLRNKVTHITITPSALTAVPTADYPALKMVLVGGEAPAPELIKHWSQGRRFINAYGPTETTVNASMVVCGNGEPVDATIWPSTNKQLYVLNEDLALQPIGVTGELHIAGVGLARGYQRQAALTAERFIPNPFNDQSRGFNAPVLYKTGDLACQLPDGRIRLLGRIDQQTKLRGFRIELGEIEHALATHADVKAAVVTIRDDDNGNKRLLAYGVPEDGSQTTSAEIKQFLTESLPRFMVPSRFIWLDELPLTANDKIDLEALPLPDADVHYTAPSTEKEIRIANEFASLLNLERVGVEDNFFELGGHSLLATRLVASLLEAYEVDLTVMDLFEAPSVGALADRVTHKEQLNELLDAPDIDDEDREEFSL